MAEGPTGDRLKVLGRTVGQGEEIAKTMLGASFRIKWAERVRGDKGKLARRDSPFNPKRSVH